MHQKNLGGWSKVTPHHHQPAVEAWVQNEGMTSMRYENVGMDVDGVVHTADEAVVDNDVENEHIGDVEAADVAHDRTACWEQDADGLPSCPLPRRPDVQSILAAAARVDNTCLLPVLGWDAALRLRPEEHDREGRPDAAWFFGVWE
mmetsp:Transcript_19356/g.35014  ORF Transcript_19356/g.35014 Transcript_19356/m.35014 type:complete len:146 (+) Transcript_19356:1190-1627(+)